MSNDNKPRRLLRLPEVMRRTGLKRTMVYVLMKRRKFPQSVKVTHATVAWIESEVQAWIDKRIQERDSKRRM